MPPTIEELASRIAALEREVSKGGERHHRDHNLRDIIGALQLRRYSVPGQVLGSDTVSRSGGNWTQASAVSNTHYFVTGMELSYTPDVDTTLLVWAQVAMSASSVAGLQRLRLWLYESDVAAADISLGGVYAGVANVFYYIPTFAPPQYLLKDTTYTYKVYVGQAGTGTPDLAVYEGEGVSSLSILPIRNP